VTTSACRVLDPESAEWRCALAGGHDAAYARLHALLLRVARSELRRRAAQLDGCERDDIAHQAAADALVSIRRRLHEFRGESRFTSWAYKFALVLDEIPLDALVHELGSSRNAIYKTLYDARRKLRALLVAGGHLSVFE
jgi:hypothetical protein